MVSPIIKQVNYVNYVNLSLNCVTSQNEEQFIFTQIEFLLRTEGSGCKKPINITDNPMKNLTQTLPIIMATAATIILTIFILLIMPIVLLWDVINLIRIKGNGQYYGSENKSLTYNDLTV